MLYFLLGILSVIAVQSILFMKYYERGLKLNIKHMIFSVLFSVYIIYVVEYLHDKVIHMNYGLVIVALMFIPVGMFMPLIYQRFKYFLFNVIYVVILNGLIFIMQSSSTDKVNALMLLFSLIGDMAGFFVWKCFNRIFPQIRKSMILKKRKRKIMIGTYEIEVITLCFATLFCILSTAENISGEDLSQKLKDTITYTQNEPVDRYADIYYADKDKYNRYDAYAKLHPEMTLEEIVWRVDANLDQEFYDENYLRYADEYTDEPLLINKFNRVSDDFEPYELAYIESDYQATPETVEAYTKLKTDLEQQGMKIYVVSAYRSVSYQRSLYNYYLRSDPKDVVDTYSSRPGYSEHHTGRAIDISQVYNNLNAFEGSDEAAWVYENAYKYGFIVRYKAEQMDVTGYIFEPWHIVYVGTEISMRMHDEGIETLEEYVVKYVQHSAT